MNRRLRVEGSDLNLVRRESKNASKGFWWALSPTKTCPAASDFFTPRKAFLEPQKPIKIQPKLVNT